MNPPPQPKSLPLLLDELIVEILSRLPVKTLMQFKCVCKSWNTLISHDPSFAELHLHRSPRNTHLSISIVSNWYRMFDDVSDIRVVPFPVSHLLEAPSSITPFEPYCKLRNIAAIPNDPYYLLSNMDCIDIVGSCNGLICLRGYSSTHWFRFWNPATNTLSQQLGHLTNFNFFRLAFGYDISNHTYKVVAFSADQVKVFSLSHNNVWRDISTFPIVPFDLEPGPCHPYVNHGVYVSGTINWLAIRNKTKYEWNDISIDQFLIVSLDLTTETYRHLLPPQGFVEVEVPRVEPSVTVLTDCLCFSHCFNDTHFVLWKMMEFGVQESWIQFLKINFLDLQIDYSISNSLEYSCQLFLFPFYLSQSDNTLIMASNQKGYDCHDNHAILYNWRDKRVEQTSYFDNEILWFHTKDYVESLVSTSSKTKTSTSSTSDVC